MGLRIQNNVEAFNTHRQLNTTSTQAAKSMEKLSSGYRINRAADDAAGLAISEKMRGQIGGLAQAQRNAQDGISLVQTAEGALTEVHSMLQRVRDLAVQYKNGTLSAEDQDAIEAEVVQLTTEITNITNPATGTQFNSKPLFGPAVTFNFQVGANDGEQITANGFNAAGTNLAGGGISELTAITNVTQAATFLGGGTVPANVDSAIKNVSKARSDFGAVPNRL